MGGVNHSLGPGKDRLTIEKPPQTPQKHRHRLRIYRPTCISTQSSHGEKLSCVAAKRERVKLTAALTMEDRGDTSQDKELMQMAINVERCLARVYIQRSQGRFIRHTSTSIPSSTSLPFQL